ncbi:hypothetical protein [Gordonia iterans]
MLDVVSGSVLVGAGVEAEEDAWFAEVELADVCTDDGAAGSSALPQAPAVSATAISAAAVAVRRELFTLISSVFDNRPTRGASVVAWIVNIPLAAAHFEGQIQIAYAMRQFLVVYRGPSKGIQLSTRYH